MKKKHYVCGLAGALAGALTLWAVLSPPEPPETPLSTPEGLLKRLPGLTGQRVGAGLYLVKRTSDPRPFGELAANRHLVPEKMPGYLAVLPRIEGVTPALSWGPFRLVGDPALVDELLEGLHQRRH